MFVFCFCLDRNAGFFWGLLFENLRRIFLLLEFFWGLLFEKGKEGVEAPSFAPYKLNRLKCWVVRTKLSAIE
jgi:hypothetical protein